MNPDSEETPKSKPECPSDQLFYTIGHGGIARPSGHTILIILKPEKKVQEHIWSKNKFYDQKQNFVKKKLLVKQKFVSKRNFGFKKIFWVKKMFVKKNSCLEQIVGPNKFWVLKFFWLK